MSAGHGGFGQIEEDAADPEIAALYGDMRATWRAAFVPTVFRTLARHRAFLLPAWAALGPGFATGEAEGAARRVRLACAERLLERPTWLLAGPPDLDLAVRREARRVLETFAYVIPKAFLAVSALREAWEGRPLTGPSPAGPILPRGVPPGMPTVPMLPEDPDDPRVRRVFDAARVLLGRPAVPSLYRTLGRWPGYLEHVWEGILDPAVTAWVREQVPDVTAEAVRLCRRLPVSLALDREAVAATLAPGAAGEIGAILATYQRNMPETLFQILRLLGGLAGSAALRAEPYAPGDRPSHPLR